jgi:hypothetical protein
MALPLTVQFNTHDEADTPVFEQGNNWENNIVWDSTRSVPQANYQGERVNFSQPSRTEYNTQMINRIDASLYTYPQQSDLASAKSDTDIWNHINRYIWGKSGSQSSPKGNWSANTNAIVPRVQKNEAAIKKIISQGTGNGMSRQQIENIIEDYHGDDISLLHLNSSSLGASQRAAKIQRDSMEAKIKSNKDEHGYFHDTLTELGKHSHGNGNGKDCGWFGEKCWDFDLGLGISLTTMAAIGVGAYLLTRKK